MDIDWDNVKIFSELVRLCGCGKVLEIDRQTEKSVFVTRQGQTYRLPKKDLTEGRGWVFRGSWSFEIYKPEDHGKVLERDANWMD